MICSFLFARKELMKEVFLVGNIGEIGLLTWLNRKKRSSSPGSAPGRTWRVRNSEDVGLEQREKGGSVLLQRLGPALAGAERALSGGMDSPGSIVESSKVK